MKGVLTLRSERQPSNLYSYLSIVTDAQEVVKTKRQNTNQPTTNREVACSLHPVSASGIIL